MHRGLIAGKLHSAERIAGRGFKGDFCIPGQAYHGPRASISIALDIPKSADIILYLYI